MMENHNILSPTQTFGLLYTILQSGLQSPKICSHVILTLNQASRNDEGSPLRPYRLANAQSMNDRTARSPSGNPTFSVVFTVPVNISSKLARSKTSQPFTCMMSSGTCKWSVTGRVKLHIHPKNLKKKYIFFTYYFR